MKKEVDKKILQKWKKRIDIDKKKGVRHLSRMRYAKVINQHQSLYLFDFGLATENVINKVTNYFNSL